MAMLNTAASCHPALEPPSPSDIENVLSFIDWVVLERDRFPERDRISLNENMDDLLDILDWDLVAPAAIRAAVQLLLEHAPESEAAALSERASTERTGLERVLAECDEDDAREAALTPEQREQAAAALAEIRERHRRETEAIERTIDDEVRPIVSAVGMLIAVRDQRPDEMPDVVATLRAKIAELGIEVRS